MRWTPHAPPCWVDTSSIVTIVPRASSPRLFPPCRVFVESATICLWSCCLSSYHLFVIVLLPLCVIFKSSCWRDVIQFVYEGLRITARPPREGNGSRNGGSAYAGEGWLNRNDVLGRGLDLGHVRDGAGSMPPMRHFQVILWARRHVAALCFTTSCGYDIGLSQVLVASSLRHGHATFPSRHRQVTVTSSSRHRQIIATSSSRLSHVIDTLSSRRRHVIATSSPRHRHVLATSSIRLRLVVVTSSSRHRHVIVSSQRCVVRRPVAGGGKAIDSRAWEEG